MKVEIRDAQAVRAIRPIEAALYLRATGWTQSESQPGRASLWLQTVHEAEYEVLLLMDQELRDYALRMGELLQTLALVEQRSQSQVYSDLLTITSDVTRIRLADPELNDGTMPIEEHARMAQKARDLMLAAACAATEHRPVWHARKPAQAVEQVRQVRIGQSERGSYIMSVITRVPPLLQPEPNALFEIAPPFERQVTQTLATSLWELGRAAEIAALKQELTAFDQAVPHGVNANLCEAVVGLWGGDEPQRSLEFSFSWSPARPAAQLPRRVTFSADRIPVIREAGRLMRERAPRLDFELRGPVVKLERAENAPTGKVTVMGLLDERQVRVSMELPDAAYHRAIQAHDQGKTVRGYGTLKKDGRSFVLQDVHDIEIEEE